MPNSWSPNSWTFGNQLQQMDTSQPKLPQGLPGRPCCVVWWAPLHPDTGLRPKENERLFGDEDYFTGVPLGEICKRVLGGIHEDPSGFGCGLVFIGGIGLWGLYLRSHVQFHFLKLWY